MLQSLRQHASSWIVKILFAFLILSFGLWGVHDIFTGERDPVVAKVSGTKITLTQLNDALRQEMARFQPLFGGTLDLDQAKQLGLVDQALNKLVDGAVFSNAVADYGLLINDEMVRRHIQNERAFYNTRGQFDRAQFRQVLSQAGYTEASYLALLRRDLASQQLIGAVSATTPVPSDLLKSLHRFRGEGRVADTITVPASDSSTPAVPDDAVIDQYYKANIERFMAPEMRTITYVSIDSAALAADAAPVSDEQLKAEYDNRIGEYTVHEKRDVDQAVLQSEAEAQKVGELLGQSKNLEQALKDANSSASAVKLGKIEKADLIPEIAEATFALKAGEHSAPIRSPLGWHVLQVNAVEEGHVEPLAEVRDDLRKDLAERAAADEAHTLAIKLDDALASGATLDEAADQAGLKAVKLPPIDVNGLTAEGKPATTLLNDPRVMRTAFTTPQGQESQLMELPRNSFAIVRVEQIVPPAAKPLADIKDEVIANWQAQERMDAAQKRAEVIAGRINKGESPAAVAESEKLPLKTTPVFSRASHDSETGLPEALKSQLFDLKVGIAGTGESQDGYVVATLKEIKPAPEMPDSTRAELTGHLSEQIAGDLLDQLALALRGRYDVEIRRDIIDSRL
jgi:peptidyl-prolyl cis-trans isomerase D